MDKKGKSHHYLFGDKTIQYCLNMDATYLYDNNLLLRRETKRRIGFAKRWYSNIIADGFRFIYLAFRFS